MIPAKEKAQQLVNNFLLYSDDGDLKNRYWKIRNAKKCAAYAVGTILDEYQSISDLESTLVVGGQVMSIVDKIVYWEEVEREIKKL